MYVTKCVRVRRTACKVQALYRAWKVWVGVSVVQVMYVRYVGARDGAYHGSKCAKERVRSVAQGGGGEQGCGAVRRCVLELDRAWGMARWRASVRCAYRDEGHLLRSSSQGQ